MPERDVTRSRGPALGIVLLAAGAAWNAGNVGPIVSSLREEFPVSLGEVGLISGGVFFAALLAVRARRERVAAAPAIWLVILFLALVAVSRRSRSCVTSPPARAIPTSWADRCGS